MKKAVEHLRRADPVLRSVIDTVGPFRMDHRPPQFATLARAIVFQQLNGKAAGAIFARLLALVDQRLTAEAVQRLSLRKLRAAGLSAQKAAYLRDLAKQTVAGALRFEDLPNLSDQEVIADLTRIKGIGLWTAQMFLMFALRRPDVLPVGDYGIRAAMERWYGLAGLPKPAQMERIALPWRPWASVACWYLWRSKDVVTL